ncbi:ubiquitinyl hydrolase 1 [Arachnomyces sp. PD_36]|nr:ubiquitinyl hydrolase 1 [Arachnomyces sp. PD_36]
MADNPDVPEDKKAFVPLENNPEVMNHMTHKLGLSPTLSFTDVYSLDDPDLLAFVPRPSTALLLVFPISQSYEAARQAEDVNIQEYTSSGPSEPVLWFKQTIRNACGLIGLLHAVCNGESRASHIQAGSDLDKIIKEAENLKPEDRAEMLYQSKALESAHADAASRGDTTAPPADGHIDLHFVCFVKDAKDGRLWEMDGRRKGPLDRGLLGPDEDVLSQKALEVGPKRFLENEKSAGGGGDLRFSLVSLGPSFD